MIDVLLYPLCRVQKKVTAKLSKCCCYGLVLLHVLLEKTHVVMLYAFL